MEPIEELLSFFNSLAEAQDWPLSAGCLAHLREIIQTSTLKQEEFLLSAGQNSRKLYFVRRGMQKDFYIVFQGVVSEWFFVEMHTGVRGKNFSGRRPSQNFIRALEDCELFYITYDEHKLLYKMFPEFNIVGLALRQRYRWIWHRKGQYLQMRKRGTHYELVNQI